MAGCAPDLLTFPQRSPASGVAAAAPVGSGEPVVDAAAPAPSGADAARRPSVTLELHVGDEAPSDVREARLLELAVQRAQLHEFLFQDGQGGAGRASSLAVRVLVHAQSGHTIAADLKAKL